MEVVTPSIHLEQLAEQSAVVVHEGGESFEEKLVDSGGDGGGGIQGVGETGADEMEHHSACASFLSAPKMKRLEQCAELDKGYEMDATAFA